VLATNKNSVIKRDIFFNFKRYKLKIIKFV